jgi:hypothetical protein
MKPITSEAPEGRANPKGILYLYLATRKETAMAEVRPWLGSYISVAQFRTLKDMVLIDCSIHHIRNVIYWKEPEDPIEREEAVWSDIDKAFSKPITSNDRSADYIPTQIIADLFKTNGFDGVYYKSLLYEGFNVALFDINSAKLSLWTYVETLIRWLFHQ